MFTIMWEIMMPIRSENMTDVQCKFNLKNYYNERKILQQMFIEVKWSSFTIREEKHDNIHSINRPIHPQKQRICYNKEKNNANVAFHSIYIILISKLRVTFSAIMNDIARINITISPRRLVRYVRQHKTNRNWSWVTQNISPPSSPHNATCKTA